MSLLLRCAALGLAAGSRSTLAVAGPVLTSSAPRAGRIAAALAVGGELVGDKLPATPSRLAGPLPAGRIAAGAVGGVLLARRRHAPVPLAAVVGAAGAVVGTWGGAAWRAWAVGRLPDWAAALLEDAVALGAAALACHADD